MTDDLEIMEDADYWLHKRASDLIGEATGGDAYYLEKLADFTDTTRDGLIDILREARLPLAGPLLSDIDALLDGAEPRYFVPADRIVQRYRENHYPSASFDEVDHGLRHISAGVEHSIRSIQREASECHEHGTSLEPYRDGAACVAEQRFFYDTDEWHDRATVVRIMDRFSCRGCGRRDERLHVHHEEHIYTVLSRHFYHNFDVDRLRCLCESCHRAFHESHIRAYSDFRFAPTVEVNRSRSERRTMERLHDATRECWHCFRRTEEWHERAEFNNNLPEAVGINGIRH